MSKLLFLDTSLNVMLVFCSVDCAFVANFILTEIWDVAEGPVVMCIFDLKQRLPLVISEILDRPFVYFTEEFVVFWGGET